MLHHVSEVSVDKPDPFKPGIVTMIFICKHIPIGRR